MKKTALNSIFPSLAFSFYYLEPIFSRSDEDFQRF